MALMANIYVYLLHVKYCAIAFCMCFLIFFSQQAWGMGPTYNKELKG